MNSSETVFLHTWPWPTWTAAIGLLLFLFLALRLTWRDTSDLGPGRRAILVGLRLAACLLLGWMLGGWILQPYRLERAKLIIAVDDSASMSFADPYRESRVSGLLRRLQMRSASNPSRFELALGLVGIGDDGGWLDELRERYDVETVLISESVRPLDPEVPKPAMLSARGQSTQLGNAIRELLARQQARPTAAMVLLTDGVNTEGEGLAEAAEAARRANIPLYTVGFGVDQATRDVRLTDLLADDVAFAGDVVPIQAQLIHEGLGRRSLRVQLKRSDRDELLDEQTVELDPTRRSFPVRLQFRPQSVGTIPLVLEVASVAEEVDRTNNRLSHVLHVNDFTLKVLLVQAYPSYEYRYLKNLLSRATRSSDSSARAFELTTVLQEADPQHADQDGSAARLFPVSREALSKFDLVLFGDVDPRLLGNAALQDLASFVQDDGGGLLIFAGPRFTPRSYEGTPLAELLPFAIDDTRVPAIPVTQSFRARLTAIGALTPACQLHSAPAENLAIWNQLPELFWNLDIRAVEPGSRVWLEHPGQTMANGLPMPLVVQSFVGSGRVVFHATDETYRWSRFEADEQYYDRYWLQTLRSLSRPRLLAGQSIAELSTDRQQYRPDESVRLRVRFHENRPQETVAVALERPGEARQDVALTRVPGEPFYEAEVRDLARGSYRAVLTAPLLDPAPPARPFTVSDGPGEQLGVPMNVAGLKDAAARAGGQFYPWYASQPILRDLPRGQQVRIESLPPRAIWNSPLVALLFVGMLAGEWLLRKRWGRL